MGNHASHVRDLGVAVGGSGSGKAVDTSREVADAVAVVTGATDYSVWVRAQHQAGLIDAYGWWTSSATCNRF